MTPIEILQRLMDIDRRGQRLLADSGYGHEDDSWARLFPVPSDPDGHYLWDAVENLMGSLAELHDGIEYLCTPLHGPYTLQRLPDGRYGYRDRDGQPHSFHCGATLEFLYHDSFGKRRWKQARMEHNGSHYYLVGAGDVRLDGLTVRERR